MGACSVSGRAAGTAPLAAGCIAGRFGADSPDISVTYVSTNVIEKNAADRATRSRITRVPTSGSASAIAAVTEARDPASAIPSSSWTGTGSVARRAVPEHDPGRNDAPGVQAAGWRRR